MLHTKLAIFDMDGLIFDSERVFMNELGKVMLNYGYKLTKDIYIQTLGLTGKNLEAKMKDNYGLDYPFAEISSEARRRVTSLFENGEVSVKYGIPELLAFLKKCAIPCVIAASTKTMYIKKYISIAGIEGFFSDVIGGEMAERSKPYPDIFVLACNRNDIVPEEALVFEDSENGVKAALSAGIKVICIPDLAVPPKDIMDKALFCAKNAFKVVEYLNKTNI